MDQCQHIAAQTTGIRRHHAQHGLSRDQRIDGTASGEQHFLSGGHGQGVRGRDAAGPALEYRAYSETRNYRQATT
jgi:hypothetical protein